VTDAPALVRLAVARSVVVKESEDHVFGCGEGSRTSGEDLAEDRAYKRLSGEGRKD